MLFPEPTPPHRIAPFFSLFKASVWCGLSSTNYSSSVKHRIGKARGPEGPLAHRSKKRRPNPIPARRLHQWRGVTDPVAVVFPGFLLVGVVLAARLVSPRQSHLTELGATPVHAV